MADLLLLAHRIPYPPNKGDKIRTYQVLKRLAAKHRVHLGTFIDDPEDEQYLPHVQAMCASTHVVRLAPGRAKLASLRGLLTGEPLTLVFYRDAGLSAWVRQLADTQPLRAAVATASSMVQFADATPELPLLLDLIDLDSAKWSGYAQAHRWPLSWLYRREGRTLLAYERAAVARARHSYLVTDNEVRLFRQLAPDVAGRVESMGNGVDAEYFSPLAGRPNPFRPGEQALVFTGAMDYWPNVDAVEWFTRDVLPALRARFPSLRLHVVGRNPTSAVRALAGEAVVVTGAVPDVRPYLQHAAVAVAPLRIARGLQNKVLEAMAMTCAVVASRPCVEAIDAVEGCDLYAAETASEYVESIARLLDAPAQAAQCGRAARNCVLSHYSWGARLELLDRHVAPIVVEAPYQKAFG